MLVYGLIFMLCAFAQRSIVPIYNKNPMEIGLYIDWAIYSCLCHQGMITPTLNLYTNPLNYWMMLLHSWQDCTACWRRSQEW